MPESNDILISFRAMYPAIDERDRPAAYECFRRYVLFTVDTLQSARSMDLTGQSQGGTVSTGMVDPERPLTNTG